MIPGRTLTMLLIREIVLKMQRPQMLLILIFFLELLFVLLIFVSLLSPSWLSVDSEKVDDTTQTYGVFKACYITEQNTNMHSRDVKSHCSHCWDTSDSDFNGDISESSLTAAQAFSVISMIAALLMFLGVIAHSVLFILEFDKLVKPSILATAVCGLLLWIVYSLACIFATRFFRQFDYVWITADEKQSVGGLDFGYGKVMTWLTWVYSLVPTGGLGFYTFQLMRGD